MSIILQEQKLEERYFPLLRKKGYNKKGKHTVVIFTYVISLWAHSVNIISSATACLRQTCWLAPLILTYVKEGYDAQNYTIHLSFQSE